MSKLTIKQEKFAQKYVECGNASEAYRHAYDAKNMQPETIHKRASELVNSGAISGRIKCLEDLRIKRHEVTADRVIAELSKLAFLDIRKAFDKNGNLIPLVDLDDDTAAAVAGLEFEELFEGRGEDRKQVGRIHKLKLSDKRAALELLARHLKLLSDKVDLQNLDKNGDPADPPAATDVPEIVAATLAAFQAVNTDAAE